MEAQNFGLKGGTLSTAPQKPVRTVMVSVPPPRPPSVLVRTDRGLREVDHTERTLVAWLDEGWRRGEQWVPVREGSPATAKLDCHYVTVVHLAR